MDHFNGGDSLSHYQRLIRVPFLLADPAGSDAGAVDSGLPSSIDMPATILARAGIQPFNGLQGRDLHGSNAPDAVIVEEDSQRTMIGFDRPQRFRTVVTERYRMSLRHGEDWNELYDLENDPHEMQNLFDDPASSGV